MGFGHLNARREMVGSLRAAAVFWTGAIGAAAAAAGSDAASKGSSQLTRYPSKHDRPAVQSPSAAESKYFGTYKGFGPSKV